MDVKNCYFLLKFHFNLLCINIIQMSDQQSNSSKKHIQIIDNNKS